MDIVRIILMILICVVAIELLWLTYSGCATLVLRGKSKYFAHDIAELTKKKKKILVVGDSFVTGVGSKYAENTLSGLIARSVPTAYVAVNARSGMTLKDASSYIIPSPHTDAWDALILLMGGMNVLAFSSETHIEQHIRLLFRKAKSVSQVVIYLSPGNTGLKPAIPIPLSYLYQARAAFFERIARRVSQEEGVVFISTFYEKHEYPRLLKWRIFSLDLTHFNDEGYTIWFESFKDKIVPYLA